MTGTDLVLKLHLAGAIGRANLAGILRCIRSSDKWTIRIASDNADFARYSLNAAAIIADHSAEESTLTAALDKGIPVVLIHRERADSGRANLGFVLTDNDAVGSAAADYLLSLGRFQTFAYVPALGNPHWSEKRGRAFLLQLRRHGFNCRAYDEHASEDLASWLKALPKPAAVFCAWDPRAVDALTAATAAGISIPTQLSVLGVDNSDLFCTTCQPQLSSVDFDAEQEGTLAVELLHALISRRNKCRTKALFGKIRRIVERESTRTPPPCAKLVESALSYIDAYATEGITARDVVAHLGVSRTLVDLRFREMGVGTISSAILERRLSILAKRIKSTRRPFAKLSLECGFTNVNHAKAAFRRHFGLTMTAMRHTANQAPSKP